MDKGDLSTTPMSKVNDKPTEVQEKVDNKPAKIQEENIIKISAGDLYQEYKDNNENSISRFIRDHKKITIRTQM